MISDDDLYKLAIFLGSAAMILIIFYHFLEVNSVEETTEEAKGDKWRAMDGGSRDGEQLGLASRGRRYQTFQSASLKQEASLALWSKLDRKLEAMDVDVHSASVLSPFKQKQINLTKMSGKLDQSLDEILSTTRRSSTRGGKAGRRVPRRAKATTAAPVGGIKKNPKVQKGPIKAIPTGPASGSGDSKILVSNLPKDVTEAMIKEYFVKSIGPIKRCDISYGPGGVSRGIATIVFARPDSASKAVETLNGVLVDGKSMKIDVILDAKHAAAIPAPKGLSERITQPKSQPKSAAATKATPSTRGKGTRGRGKAKNARPAKKTAEELDSEMVDYFGGGSADAGASGAAQPAAGGDANMDDEILGFSFKGYGNRGFIEIVIILCDTCIQAGTIEIVFPE
ncbi:hypothetical protein G7Y89_g4440 [Cudoniella acicularis]|uniref:RRM domain-containing protein n=1 Tax=Cudoniella acicularis TaxID=354080 RepID=A0A8H4RPG1_9HELO|nr:hypothetical protein G7Y89_g4440 [Cudoniella acicularis]